MPGPITRLLACDEDRLKTCVPEQPAHGNASRGAQPWSRRLTRRPSRARSYKYTDVVPTHVHPNFDKLHMADIGDNYVPYNKPGSIKHWCAASRKPRSAAEPPHRRALPRNCWLCARSRNRAWRLRGFCAPTECRSVAHVMSPAQAGAHERD
jgi:hypothetical protein